MALTFSMFVCILVFVYLPYSWNPLGLLLRIDLTVYVSVSVDDKRFYLAGLVLSCLPFPFPIVRILQCRGALAP